jgi:hypothetical protein
VTAMDDEPTAPHRQIPAQCPSCLRPRTSHAEACLLIADQERIHRELAARAHFFRMTQLDRILALGIGAAKRGSIFHYHGDVR